MLHTERLTNLETFSTPGVGESLIQRVVRTMYVWQKRMTERARLAELDQRTLVDVGLSRDQIAAEVAKPFWRP
ncbi:MAG: DUF1127 domain-containing protein [Gammaproteobacteria bacterium]|nr:DUF1127 domain-containing protein [Gammaproteobacteria bacterium]